jgi:hypothetical protein
MLAVILAAALVSSADNAAAAFAIEVIDEQTGRGVPLVELTTTSGVTYVTDSAGLVAFNEPGLMNQRVYFAVKSHGYEIEKDGFGFPGRAFDIRPGGSGQIKIKRLNIAERLYRLTGEGIYRDSILLGREPPIRQPLINGRVSGSDSTMNAVYHGRLHWFWGDTNWPAYPLGLFHMSGAVSQLPGQGGLRADQGVDLEYYVGDKGFARGMAEMPGQGPTWINGLAVLPDASGKERMLCGYAKIKPPMDVHRRGLAIWNDAAERFELLDEFPLIQPLFPDGHTLIVEESGARYLYFASPFPLVRTRATAEAYQDLDSYEAFTCLMPGSTVETPQIDRDELGRPRYRWKPNAPPVNAQDQTKLLRQGHLKADEGWIQTRDKATGKTVILHSGSVNWNEYRKRYVMIAVEIFGTSMLGEVWYAEAESPVGPWNKAVKIATHDKYSFYNPKQHPYFDQEGGRIIYFEGTYTHSFSRNDQRTPRYDYNQIMYRLDLADERLN